MTIEWTPGIKLKLDALVVSGEKVTGFVLGSQMGHVFILEDILLLPFLKKNVKNIYRITSQKYEEKLLGFLFNSRNIIKQPWMMNDLYVLVNGSQIDVCQYDSDGMLKPLNTIKLGEGDG